MLFFEHSVQIRCGPCTLPPNPELRSRGRKKSCLILALEQKGSTLFFCQICQDRIQGDQALEDYFKAHGLRPATVLSRGISQGQLAQRLAESALVNAEQVLSYFDLNRAEPDPEPSCSIATKQKKAPSPRPARRTANALQELDQLVGLTQAKQVVHQAVDYGRAQQLYRERGFQPQSLGMHMVFSGSPGTAKTTVARLVARIFCENGVLSKGNLVEVGRGDLIGKYAGWTAQQVKKKINEAKGGVLFVDEAYSLLEDKEGQYGDEAINTLVQEMENRRQDMVVILAGYREPMDRLLDRNSGLRSRITFQLDFPDYTEEELLQIFHGQLASHQRTVDGAGEARFRELLHTAMEQPDFGNGRFVRTAVERALLAQASRLMRLNPEQISNDDIRLLTAQDFGSCPLPSTSRQTRPIGFLPQN